MSAEPASLLIIADVGTAARAGVNADAAIRDTPGGCQRFAPG